MTSEITNRERYRLLGLHILEDILREAQANLYESDDSALAVCLQFAANADEVDKISEPISRVSAALSRAIWQLDATYKIMLSDIEAFEAEDC